MATYKRLEVVRHDSPDIIEFIFKDNSRDVVDEYVEAFFEIAEQLRAQDKLDKPLWFLIDMTEAGVYPLQYSRKKISELIANTAYLPTIYFAYLVDDAQDRYWISNFETIGNPRQQDRRKVFSGAKRDAAIEWLTSHDEL